MRRATGFEVDAPETVYFAAQGTLDSYRKHGVDKYEYLATLDARTSDKCAALDGKVFDVERAVPGENYPPAHPNCRSTTMAYFPEDEEEDGERIAKDKDGKMQYVPADMSYEKWYNTYVNEHKIDIEIDGFTHCLKDAKTGEVLKTVFDEVAVAELRSLKKKGWVFDWPKVKSEGHNIYALRLEGDNTIQGLISWYSNKYKASVEVPVVENAPHNVGNNKRYIGVGAHLFALVALKSFKLGHEGFITFTAKTNLIQHYEDELGAELLTKTGKMYISGEKAKKLIARYFGGGLDGKAK